VASWSICPDCGGVIADLTVHAPRCAAITALLNPEPEPDPEENP
jgi:hypothetical protein